MDTKLIRECQIGDYITTGTVIYQIKAIGKTSLTAAKMDNPAKTIRVSFSGRVHGQGGYAKGIYDLNEYIAYVKSLADKAAKEEKERQAKHDAKLADVQAANHYSLGYLRAGDPEYSFGDLRIVKFINKRKEEGLIIYQQKEDDYWIDSGHCVNGFVITPILYRTERFGSSKEEYRFSTPTSVRGVTPYTMLLQIVASYCWE